MDSEQSERIVLAVVTNLDTRFVVLPLRSETVGDVRGTIKSYHMNLFPAFGEVDVKAMEVELFGNRSRVADPTTVGHLFWKASQAVIFAEVVSSISNSLAEEPKLKLPGPLEVNVASEHELGQNADRSVAPLPKKRGDISHSKPGNSVIEHNVGDAGHGGVPEVAERKLKPKKRGHDELKSAPEAGEEQRPIELAVVDIGEPATKKTCITEPESRAPTDMHSARKIMLVVESKLESDNADGPGIGQRSALPHPKKGQEISSSPSEPTEKDVVIKSARALKFTRESNKIDGSRSGNQSDHQVAEKLPTDKDVVVKSARSLDFTRGSNKKDGAPTSSKTDHPVVDKLPAEPSLGSLKPIENSGTKTLKALDSEDDSSSGDASGSGDWSDARESDVQDEPGLVPSKSSDKDVEGNLLAVESSPESSSTGTGSQNGMSSGKQTDELEVVGLVTPEKKVSSGGPQTLNGVSKPGSLKGESSERRGTNMSPGTSSGGSSVETAGQNEDSGDKSAESRGNNNSDGSSTESDSEEASKSAKATEGSAVADSDQTSDDESSPRSSEESESETLESSCDESDESDSMPPKGRTLDFSTPEDGGRAARSIGRRKVTGSVDPKYQHLLDSQDGFEELISLSQQKKLSSVSQLDLLPAEPLGSLAPVSLGDDIDLVPDTQAENPTTADAVENNVKDTKLSTQESATVRKSAIQGEDTRPESSQDAGDDGERLQCTSGPSPSVKLGEASLLLSVKDELLSTGGGKAVKALELGEVTPPQSKSDPQNIRAALQLARMSGGKVADSNLVDANLVDANLEVSPKIKPMRGKQRISSNAKGTAKTQVKKLQERNRQQKESPPPVLLALEANEVITKPKSVSADENLIGTQFTGVVAPVAELEKKKQRKRSREELNIEKALDKINGQTKTNGQMKTAEDDPSPGSLDGHGNTGDETGNKENGGKTPQFEYRDLRKSGKLAIDHNAVDKIMSGLKRDKVPKSLNTNDKQGSEEKQAALTQQAKPTDTFICTICNPPASYTRKEGVLRHIQKVHKWNRADITTELWQRIEGTEQVGNKSKLDVAVDKKDSTSSPEKQLNDAEPANLGFEDLSGLLRKESIDAEIEKGLQQVGSKKEPRSQANVESQSNGKPARKKQGNKKTHEDLSEKSSKGKRDQDAIQNAKSDTSLLSQKFDAVSDKGEKGEEEHALDEKRSNVDEEDEADEEHPVVSNEPKNSEKVGKSPKSVAGKLKKKNDKPKIPKKQSKGEVAEDAEQAANPTVQETEHAAIPLGSGSMESAEAHLPVDKAEKEPTSPSGRTKRKREKSDVPTKGSRGEVAVDVEQVANPSALRTQDEQNKTSLKQERKKPKKVEPPVESSDSEGELAEGQEVELEDQIATPLSQEAVKNASLKESNGNTTNEGDAGEVQPDESRPKRSKTKKLLEEVSLQEEEASVGKKKTMSSSKNSKSSKLSKAQQTKPSAGKKAVNSTPKKKVEGDGTKKNQKDKSRVIGDSGNNPVHCPHGCGKVYSKKTSAFFRHQNDCTLARTPNFE